MSPSKSFLKHLHRLWRPLRGHVDEVLLAFIFLATTSVAVRGGCAFLYYEPIDPQNRHTLMTLSIFGVCVPPLTYLLCLQLKHYKFGLSLALIAFLVLFDRVERFYRNGALDLGVPQNEQALVIRKDDSSQGLFMGLAIRRGGDQVYVTRQASLSFFVQHQVGDLVMLQVKPGLFGVEWISGFEGEVN